MSSFRQVPAARQPREQLEAAAPSLGLTHLPRVLGPQLLHKLSGAAELLLQGWHLREDLRLQEGGGAGLWSWPGAPICHGWLRAPALSCVSLHPPHLRLPLLFFFFLQHPRATCRQKVFYTEWHPQAFIVL